MTVDFFYPEILEIALYLLLKLLSLCAPVALVSPLLLVAILAVDTVLSGRYSGGDGRHDRDTSRMLVISLAFNMAFALFSGWSAWMAG